MLALGISIFLYLVAMFGLALWANKKIENVEDFLVAGRRLPLSLAWATLFATWVGAGAVLTCADEVRTEGVRITALEPFGAGVCLILAGLFYAKPLWNMKICTFADIFRIRFGKRAEKISAIVVIPGYFGWVAVQIIALAGILNVFFDLPLAWGILAVAFVATAYTLLGGMWSVTLTDAVQVILLLIGLVTLGYNAFVFFGNDSFSAGISRLLTETPAEKQIFIPRDSLKEFVGWMGVFLVGALGNLPGQDLTQRIFSAKSAKVASISCVLAGLLYVVIGIIPISLGLLADHILSKEVTASVVPALAKEILTPGLQVIFILTLLSMVLSTIDSAILAPASVLAQNLLQDFFPQQNPIRLNQFAILFVAGASLAVAYIGEDVFGILEASYSIGLVALFIPFTIALFSSKLNENAAIVAMLFGTAIWIVSLLVEDEVLAEILILAATVVSLIAYFVTWHILSSREKTE